MIMVPAVLIESEPRAMLHVVALTGVREPTSGSSSMILISHPSTQIAG
jgi:hypothetical protein